jgi:hypothetical protein
MENIARLQSSVLTLAAERAQFIYIITRGLLEYLVTLCCTWTL